MSERALHEAVIEGLGSDCLMGSHICRAMADHHLSVFSEDQMMDWVKRIDRRLTRSALRIIVDRLIMLGLIEVDGAKYHTSYSGRKLERVSIALRGASYGAQLREDESRARVVFSKPAAPSHLMEILPKHSSAWAHLVDTDESFIGLASESKNSFLIVTPFIDGVGLDWILELFSIAKSNGATCELITRANSPDDLQLLDERRDDLSRLEVKVYSYAIRHEKGSRFPEVETFHAKMIFSDDKRVFIGSSNMTKASKAVSLECGVILEGEAVRPLVALANGIKEVSKQKMA